MVLEPLTRGNLPYAQPLNSQMLRSCTESRPNPLWFEEQVLPPPPPPEIFYSVIHGEGTTPSLK